ncbi:MAG: CHAT domain-containing protein [Pyrinomonadaceae bacterium]
MSTARKTSSLRTSPKPSATARSTAPTGREESSSTRRASYFAPLNGTAQEARSIQILFPEANSLTGAQATESAVKQAAAPRILHVATHNFFPQDSQLKSQAQCRARCAGCPRREETSPLQTGLGKFRLSQFRGREDDDANLRKRRYARNP